MTTQKQDELIASYNKKCNELNEVKQKNHMLLTLRDLDNEKLYDLTRQVEFYKTIDSNRNQELTSALEAKDQLSKLLTQADKKISELEFQNNSLVDQYIDALHDDDRMVSIRDELLAANKKIETYIVGAENAKQAIEHQALTINLLQEKVKHLTSENEAIRNDISLHIDYCNENASTVLELEDKFLMAEDRILELEKELVQANQRITTQVCTIAKLQNEIKSMQREKEPDQTPVVPLSATPGWGQLGFLDPNTSYQPITKVPPTNVKYTSSDSKPIGWTDGVLSGRAEWNDYNTGG